MIVLTRSGREAIALAMRLWKVAPGDEVLVPAYNCGSEISPVIATGARVLMYRVDRNAEIDVHDIRRRLSGRTKIVFVTHYFGRPVDLRQLAPLCLDAGVKLLEDCAHSLFGAGVGAVGDAGVFSLRKTLPASDGGVLAIRSSGIDESDLRLEAPPSLALRGTLSLIKRWLLRRLAIGASTAAGVDATNEDMTLPDVPKSYYFAPGAPVAGASRLARGLLSKTNKNEIVNLRRTNYRRLRAAMNCVRGFSPLWAERSDEPVFCPLGLPGLVEDRELWRRKLVAAGAPVSAWWAGFHRGLDWDGFPEAKMLKQRLILLPVHQGLTAPDLDYIAAVARRIESEPAI